MTVRKQIAAAQQAVDEWVSSSTTNARISPWI
jgi:hypothetical protein